MNVVRMVKLFGWEKKIEDRISEKREEELVWLWRRLVLELVNNNIKLVYIGGFFNLIKTKLFFTVLLYPFLWWRPLILPSESVVLPSHPPIYLTTTCSVCFRLSLMTLQTDFLCFRPLSWNKSSKRRSRLVRWRCLTFYGNSFSL